MIFASDLDRTLIYSQRALDELSFKQALPSLRPVEKKADNEVSFMTETAYNLLMELCQRSLFIPSTTRNTEQFKRINVFTENIPFTYAITFNGAGILYHGDPLQEWEDYITSILSRAKVSLKMFKQILEQTFWFDGELRQAKNLFFYYFLNTLPSRQALSDVAEFASRIGWKCSIQGRKLYFIPNEINKGTALEFICKREGDMVVAGAGDSLFDWDFLQNCKYRFVPRHGELAKETNLSGLTITKSQGIIAGEEILKKFHTLMTTPGVVTF